VSPKSMLSDLCLWSHAHCDDDLIVLDAHLRRLHLVPLRPTMTLSADMNSSTNANANARGREEVKMASPVLLSAFELDLHSVSESVKRIFGQSLPPSFALSSPSSLKWVLENIKRRVESEVIGPLESARLSMAERECLVSSQCAEFVRPQMRLLNDKARQIRENNEKLKRKVRTLSENHKEMTERVLRVKERMKGREGESAKNEFKFSAVLREYEREYAAAAFDLKQLEQYEMRKQGPADMEWTSQDRLHLERKIKTSLTESDQMLKQIVNGLQQL